MTPLRVAIVDDEAPARVLLREYLTAEPGIAIVAECANGFEAVQAVAELHPDLLLLDVQMPRLSGFDVLELVEREVAVVFVTAYDAYAVRAFEVQAIDYLLKPVAPERLHQALARARERLGHGQLPSAARLRADAEPSAKPLDRLVVRDGGRVEIIPVEALDVVQAEDDGVELRAGGRTFRKAGTMNELESRLDPRRFVRVHRCFLLNVKRIARLELYARDSRLAVLTDGSKIPVSRRGFARLRELL